MSRYSRALVILVAAVLSGCGGGQSPMNNSPSTKGTSTPGTLLFSTSSTNFGSVAVGSSTTRTAQITASNSAITISSGNWNGNGFSLSGITFPLTLAAGQSASVTVNFAPQSSGSISSGVSLISNATNSPTIETFTGTGTQSSNPPSSPPPSNPPSSPPSNPPTAHSVSLFWSPSPSAVIGYNVYRGTASGGPYPTKLTSAPQATTSLTDDSVMGGTTYYYVATSVDQDSVESVFSNEFSATIP